jgi:hypothetical protein
MDPKDGSPIILAPGASSTAEPGDPPFLLDKVLGPGPHLAEGYVGSVVNICVDTKRGYASNREGIDPETGRLYLEEVVFEVVYKPSEEETTKRAQGFAAVASGARLRSSVLEAREHAAFRRLAGTNSRHLRFRDRDAGRRLSRHFSTSTTPTIRQ